MSKSYVYKENTKAKNALNMSIGVGVAVIVSLVLILVFALLIKWFDLSDSVITPANIIIKILSIAVGIVFVTKDGKSGAKRGALLGAVYIILCFGVFSLLNKSLIIGMSLLYDFILGVASGAILGIIAVNLRR